MQVRFPRGLRQIQGTIESEAAATTCASANQYPGGAGCGTKAGFNLAREVLNIKVEDREFDISDISLDTVGSFDVALFSGVPYHICHPSWHWSALPASRRRFWYWKPTSMMSGLLLGRGYGTDVTTRVPGDGFRSVPPLPIKTSRFRSTVTAAKDGQP